MVELMLVVVLLGLVTTMVSVSYDAMVPGERLNTTVRELAAAIQGARTEAVSRNAEFYIEYDLAEHRYRLITPFRRGGGMWIPELEEDEERYLGAWGHLRPGVEFAQITLAGQTYTDNPPLWVRFDPLGAASDHQIVLRQPAYELQRGLRGALAESAPLQRAQQALIEQRGVRPAQAAPPAIPVQQPVGPQPVGQRPSSPEHRLS